MRTIGLLLLAAGMGCSTSASTATTASAPTPSTQGEELALTAPTPGHLETREAPDAALPEFDAEQLASLPEAPWSEAPLAVTQAPADLLAARRSASVNARSVPESPLRVSKPSSTRRASTPASSLTRNAWKSAR